MIKANYHTHSCYCDGKETPKQYVEMAIAKGFTHIGFSGHAPVPFENTFAISADKYSEYCSQIQQLKNRYSHKIKISLGLEIDYIPGIIDNFKPLIDEGNLDYCIGSVHLVNKNKGSDLWFIDGSRQELYDQGLQRVFGGDIKQAVTAFFAQTNEMITTQKPTIVGHLNKVVMHNKERYFNTSDRWYMALVEETLELAKENNCICEINTRGIYKGRYNDYYPSKEIIKIMNEKNIPAVVSTDAHHPDDLDKFEGIYEYLKQINYKNILYLDSDGIWKDYSI